MNEERSPLPSMLLIVAAVVIVGVALFLYFAGRPGEPDAPRTGAQEAVDLHPAIATGVEAMRAEHLEEARAAFESVPPEHASHSVALHNLGALLERMGKPEEARAAFAAIVPLQPDNPEPWISLAWVEYGLGRYRDAEYDVLRALELDPDHDGARYQLGLFRLASDENLGDAIASYRRAMVQGGDRGSAYRALEDLLRLQQQRPELAAAHYAIAFFANTLKRPDLEREHLEGFLALDPAGEAAARARERLTELGAPQPSG